MKTKKQMKGKITNGFEFISEAEIKKGVSRTTKLTQYRDFRLSLATDSCRYVRLFCQHNGILLIGSMEKPENGFVVPYDTWGRCRLPYSVIRAYGLSSECFELVKLDPESYFLKKECDQLPEPLIGNLNFDDSTIDLDKLTPFFELQARHCKMSSAYSFNPGLIELYDTLKVTVHMGACLRIDVACPTDEEIGAIPDYKTLRKEYWHNFSDYVGEQLTFICRRNKDGSFSIPQPFRLKAGLSKGDHLDGFFGPYTNGQPTYVFAPKATTCGLCGEVLDPLVSVPETAPLCSPCANNEDKLKAIYDAMAYLRQTIERQDEMLDFQKKTEEMQVRLEELRAENARITKLNMELEENMSAMAKELSDERKKHEELLALFNKRKE